MESAQAVICKMTTGLIRHDESLVEFHRSLPVLILQQNQTCAVFASTERLAMSATKVLPEDGGTEV
jgi:hypothetical protein